MVQPAKVSLKIDTFFSTYPLRKLDKNQVIIQAGDEPKQIIYLLKGNVQQYDISPSGDRVVINIFKPNSFFPMSWAINKTPNDYFFETASKVSYRSAPPSDVLEFLKSNPDVTFDLLSRVYRGLDGVLRRMAHLMGGNAKTRLIYELINESKRFGHKKPNGNIVLELTEHQIANRAGLSRETVSRNFSKLNKQGLITVNRQQIIISDLKKLEKALGSDL